MRLIGYGFVRADAPARVGYLPLDDLTVLIGANDAGKSRLLEALAVHMGGATLTPEGLEASAFFMDLNEEEAARLAESELTDEELASIERQFSLPIRLKKALGDETLMAAIAESKVAAAVEPLRPHEETAAFRCLASQAAKRFNVELPEALQIGKAL
jgi:ATPase subunit of ABC transporter with duplicated ATPase domains